MASQTSWPPVTVRLIRSDDVEAGVAPGLLHRAHEVAGQPLLRQLGRHLGVEHDEAAAGQHRGGVRPGLLGVDDGLEGVLALLRASPPAVTVPSSATDQSPDLLPLIACLHVAAQPRAGGPGVDDEPLA